MLAAVQEGYEAVGIEMSDAYFRRSTERLKTALESEVNQNGFTFDRQLKNSESNLIHSRNSERKHENETTLGFYLRQ